MSISIVWFEKDFKVGNTIEQICQNFAMHFFRIHAIVQFMQYDSMQCSLACHSFSLPEEDLNVFSVNFI